MALCAIWANKPDNICAHANLHSGFWTFSIRVLPLLLQLFRNVLALLVFFNKNWNCIWARLLPMLISAPASLAKLVTSCGNSMIDLVYALNMTLAFLATISYFAQFSESKSTTAINNRQRHLLQMLKVGLGSVCGIAWVSGRDTTVLLEPWAAEQQAQFWGTFLQIRPLSLRNVLQGPGYSATGLRTRSVYLFHNSGLPAYASAPSRK